MKIHTGNPRFLRLMWGVKRQRKSKTMEIENHGNRKPWKSRLLTSTKGEEDFLK
jgi:hypothetical protein